MEQFMGLQIRTVLPKVFHEIQKFCCLFILCRIAGNALRKIIVYPSFLFPLCPYLRKLLI